MVIQSLINPEEDPEEMMYELYDEMFNAFINNNLDAFLEELEKQNRVDLLQKLKNRIFVHLDELMEERDLDSIMAEGTIYYKIIDVLKNISKQVKISPMKFKGRM